MPSRRLLLMNTRKRIALIAHDNRKHDLLDWARCNRGILLHHDLYATGTTGALLASELGFDITRFASGPLGGDQQVGAAVVEGKVDFVIFFTDPLEPHPHDVDVKALMRVAVVYNIPLACNRTTADFLVASSLMSEEYRRLTMGIEDQLVHWVLRPPQQTEARALPAHEEMRLETLG